ncbi:WXG100 family type VII secretion target [Streptomyces mayteni]
MEPSEPAADLRVDSAVLRELAGRAEQLVNRLDATLRNLRTEDGGALRRLDPLTSADVLRRVQQSWTGRLTALKQDCDGLSSGLNGAADDFDATEAGVRESIDGAGRLPDWAEPREEAAR